MIAPAEAPARALTLVTGATGFTGSHLVRSLVADGVPVRVIARSAERARQLLPDGVEIVEGDIADPDVIERAMQGVGTVYHLAAVYREAKHPDLRYREVNVEASRLLLEAAVRASVRRYVHCSTVGVHGHIASPPADESAAYAPGDVYQATKCEAEQLALSYRDRIPLAVARPTAIYGPGDTRLLKMFRLITQQRFPLLGGGENYYHTVHVKDLVRGLRLLGTHSRAVGEVFILGGESYLKLSELAAMIASVAGVPAPVAAPAGSSLPARRVSGGEALRPARHRAADLPPPGGLLHQEPGLQHREGPPSPGVSARGEARGRHPGDDGLVRGPRLPPAQGAARGRLPAMTLAATPAREDADVESSSELYARRFAGPVGQWFLELQARLTLECLRGLPPVRRCWMWGAGTRSWPRRWSMPAIR